MSNEDIRNIAEAVMYRWEPGTLSMNTVRRILIDAMADAWFDCNKPGQPTTQQFQVFRERMAACLYAATGINMQVVRG